MTTVLARRLWPDHGLLPQTFSLDQLLQPEDIRFSGGLDGAVRIEITFRNQATRPSPSVMARIEAAPLGAFVPGVTLARVQVPGLYPGQSWVFMRRVPYTPATANQGGRARVDAAVATALDMGDLPRPVPKLTLADLYRSRPQRSLPADPFHAAGRGSIHWAGNINVFVGTESVERHMAMALRVQPGVTNAARFVVGGGVPDAYRFELRGDGMAWQPEISYALYDELRPRYDWTAASVAPGSWIDTPTRLVAQLSFDPPADCAGGSLDVLIVQRSSDRTACVEFSFAADAEGPGCFML